MFIFGGGAPSGYQISRSLRLRAANSAYLSRTFGAGGNQKKWTWAGWVKRGQLGVRQDFYSVFDTNTDTGAFYFNFGIDDCLHVTSYSVDYRITTQVFRDPGAWMFVLVALDAANTTSRVEINGVAVSSFSTNNTIINQNYAMGGAFTHILGQSQTTGPVNGRFCDLNLAEVHYIDGQYLDSTSFGQFDATTGVFTPKAYTGSYGTVGYYLDFSDNSAATAAAIGADRSGNGNNWTPTGISVAAGVTNDSLKDTPTNGGTDTGAGGEVTGNYCTLNPVGSAAVCTNGNLDTSAMAGVSVFGSIWFSSGKWYWETTVNNVSTSVNLGIIDDTFLKTDASWTTQAAVYTNVGNKYNGSAVAYGAAYTTGDVIGTAYDADNGILTFYKNGVSQGVAFNSGLAGRTFRPISYGNTAATLSHNFGQRPFAYAAPSGFKALCTQNLPDPAIKQPSLYMDVNTRTGTGATANITGKAFQPDLVWMKSRSAATAHAIYDSVRGVQKDITIGSAQETTEATGLTAFNSDGFTIGALAKLNTSAATYVDWLWKKGTTPLIDIVTYTGTGANQSVPHGLGVAPKMVITKERNTTNRDLYTWHAGLSGVNDYLLFDGADAKATLSTVFTGVPTSSNILVGTSAAANESGASYVAFVFGEVPGFSKFGSYTGNGSADGPFVWLGFMPAFVLIKRTDSTSDWYIWDTVRDTYNVVSATLLADSSAAETSAASIDATSNGFKCRSSTVVNVSGGTYVYAAFAKSPFKYTRAR